MGSRLHHLLLCLVVTAAALIFTEGYRIPPYVAARAIAALISLQPTAAAHAATANGVKYTQTQSGVSFYDYPSGEGDVTTEREQIKDGSKIAIAVKGYLAGRNGWNFIDTTAIEDGEIRLVLGKTRVIKGLELGLTGTAEGDMPAMRRGDKRRLVIPSQLGYQDEGQQPLPADDDYRRRLFSTVFNEERGAREREALGGSSVVGELVLDVKAVKVRN